MKVFIPMGARRVGKGEGTLSVAGLGSCVAIILYDAEARIGGLAHVLLPDPSLSSSSTRRWLCASTAIPDLLKELEEAGAVRSRITARLVGGSRMFQELLPSEEPNVGDRNVAAARTALEQRGIPITAEEVGGKFGRTVDFHLEDGRLQVSSQGKDLVEI